MLHLLDAAYKQVQLQVTGRGDPRDPSTKHRSAAAYRTWFQSTAGGAVLEQARSRTSNRACACMCTNLRLRLGAVSPTEGAKDFQQLYRGSLGKEALALLRTW